LAVAGASADGFPDGCWLAELAPTASGEDVVRAVAVALGAPVKDLDALVGYLSDRRVLIVLDNCEHVLANAADLVGRVLDAAPEVVVVATSREPLGVEGEVVRVVRSMEVPEPDSDLSEAVASAAVRLFVDRAIAASEQFSLGEDNVGSVVEICRRLDGIPLALELAAARVRAMAPAEIARRLSERFRLLSAGRGAIERHRTLLGAVSWSYDLLAETDRQVFGRLAVFPASFDLDAAEAVAGPEGDVIDSVLRLVDRSLVGHDPATGRYQLLETLRQYAADRIGETGEVDAVRDAHAAFFCTMVEKLAPRLLDAGYDDAVARLVPELDNLRAAAGWLAESGHLDDLRGLAHRAFPLLMQWAPPDGARWLRQAIDGQDSNDDEPVDATGELSYLVIMLGEVDSALGLADRSIRLAEDSGLPASPWAWATKVVGGNFTDDPQGSVSAAAAGLAVASARNDDFIASLLPAMTVAPLAALGQFDASQAAADTSLTVALRTGNPVAISWAVGGAIDARLYRNPPDLAGAIDILERKADNHRLADDNLTGNWVQLFRGIAILGAQRRAAVSLLTRCLRNADRLNNLPGAELAVRLLVLDAAAAGQIETAATLLGYLESNLAAYRYQAAGLVWLDHLIVQALDTLAPEQRALHHARGAALTRRELMDLVATLEQTLSQPIQNDDAPLHTAGSDDLGQRSS
jgi:predicted ATPase